jgi:antitoxin (DNA-binding transcriptional repressor) of toxin-antitoxin stability system
MFDISSILMEIEEKNETFIFYRDGIPVADLIPHQQIKRRVPHPTMSAIKINYDPTEMLAQDEWTEEE